MKKIKLSKIELSKKKKLIVGILTLVLCVCIPIGIALAKFIKKDTVYTTPMRDVIADFYVEITDKERKAVEIDIKDLFPGKTQYIDFFVRSGKAGDENGDGAKKLEMDISYTVSLLRTGNLPVVYELYAFNDELTPEQEEVIGENTVENSGDVINFIKMEKNTEAGTGESGGAGVALGTNTIVDNFVPQDGEKFVLKKSSEDGEDYDRYRLKVSWDKDEQDPKFINEVDLVYLIVNAQQEEPQVDSSSVEP
ncbi:MAG: hypothetical protein E7262_07480 [Lachnospiraceae bacterium]|nr:hypothetical protein [Lachnospiraceae bacterium]